MDPIGLFLVSLLAGMILFAGGLLVAVLLLQRSLQRAFARSGGKVWPKSPTHPRERGQERVLRAFAVRQRARRS